MKWIELNTMIRKERDSLCFASTETLTASTRPLHAYVRRWLKCNQMQLILSMHRILQSEQTCLKLWNVVLAQYEQTPKGHVAKKLPDFFR